MFKAIGTKQNLEQLDEIFKISCNIATEEFKAREQIDGTKPDFGEYETRVLYNVYNGIRGAKQTFTSKDKFPEFEKWTHDKIEDYKKSDPSVMNLGDRVKKSWEENFKT